MLYLLSILLRISVPIHHVWFAGKRNWREHFAFMTRFPCQALLSSFRVTLPPTTCPGALPSSKRRHIVHGSRRISSGSCAMSGYSEKGSKRRRCDRWAMKMTRGGDDGVMMRADTSIYSPRRKMTNCDYYQAVGLNLKRRLLRMRWKFCHLLHSGEMRRRSEDLATFHSTCVNLWKVEKNMTIIMDLHFASAITELLVREVMK